LWLKQTILATQKIKVLLFDLGGVIIDLFPERTIASFAQLANKTERAVADAYEGAGIFQQHEKGLIGNEEFRAEIQQHFAFSADSSAFDTAWNAMLGDIPSDIVASVETLKTRYKCCVLSNTNAIHEKAFHQILAKQHGLRHLNELFDKVYFSHELKERKPDEAVYLKVISDLGLKAEEVLFLDDSEINIAAAKAVGIQGLYIPRNGGFQNLLKAYLKA
jgi:FMN phosphatase YigB (HAD superfamily)